MERDFLGLNSKEHSVVVKEEVLSTDVDKDIGFTSGTVAQWPFFNHVALPNLMSFKVAEEDQIKKTKSFNHSSQGGNLCSLTAYPLQHDMHPMHQHHDVKISPVPNHAISISMSNPFFKNHYATTGQNLASTVRKPQLLGEIPVTASHSMLPTLGSVAGISESCVKVSGSPAQLTIFYAGTVNVYDDISPEKAQAIMFLAGKGSSISPNMAQPKIQNHASSPKPAAADVGPVSQPTTTPPCSGLSSPLSVSSHTGAQSGSGSTSVDDIVAKTNGVATSPVCKLESPKTTAAMGSVSAITMIPSVPQARKASLARFLEKRKERVMNAAPYNLNKDYLEFATQKPLA